MVDGLIYIGGARWLTGIPARDLSAEEVRIFGGDKYLIATGLYKRPPAPKPGKAADLTPAKEKEITHA